MKYLMTLLMAALLVNTASAQEKKGEMSEMKSRSEMMTERMTEELGLNAEQVAKVEAITLKFDDKATGKRSAIVTKEIAPDKEGAMTEMNEALKEVLTPEQYEQWTKIGARDHGTTPDGRKINEANTIE